MSSYVTFITNYLLHRKKIFFHVSMQAVQALFVKQTSVKFKRWSFPQKPRKPVSVIILRRQRILVALQILLLLREPKDIDRWIRLVCVILYLYCARRPLWTSQDWTWANRSITPMFTTRSTATCWTSKSRYTVIIISLVVCSSVLMFTSPSFILFQFPPCFSCLFVLSSSFPHVHSWVIINKLLNVCSDTLSMAPLYFLSPLPLCTML